MSPNFTRVLRASRSRGSVTLGLAVVVAAVAGGMALGTGVARHHVSSGYDLQWLPDSKRGQVVQVDPSANKANLRLQVAPAGHRLSVQQGDGHLIVTDNTTGKTTSIDLSTLLVTGSRRDAATAVKVLLDGSRMYVANLQTGLVQAVDPTTQRSIGRPWQAGGHLIDVVVDGHHAIWALDARNHLVKLTWSTGSDTLARTQSTTVRGTGAGSVVVGHDSGVTVVGTGGVVTSVGTGSDDGSQTTTRPTGPLVAGPNSPGDLTPVSNPGGSTVTIVNGGSPQTSPTASMGCPRPGAPVAFGGLVYVPCLGSSKVLVLDRDGQPAGAALRTPPGGDPQIVVGSDQLLITVPGATYTTVIDRNGTASTIQVVDPTIGVQQPTDPPPAPPTPPTHVPTPPQHGGGDHNGNPGDHGGDHGGNPGGGSGGWGGGSGSGGGAGSGGGPGHGGGHHPGWGGPGGSSAPGSGTPSGTTPGSGTPSTSATSSTPTGGGSTAPASGQASAAAQGDGSVVVSWTSTGDAGASYQVWVLGGSKVADAAPGATSATVTVLAPGTTAAFEVQAYAANGGTLLWKADTAAVTSYTAPGAVTGVAVQATQSGASAILAISWTAAAANGRPVTYTVAADGASPITTTGTSASITVACSPSCSGTVTVTPHSDAGTGAAGSAPFNSSVPPPPPPNPAPGETVVTVANETDGFDNGDNTSSPAEVDLTITAPPDWAASVGTTCTLYADSVAEGTVACNSSGVGKSFTYPAFGRHTHTYYVTATWGGGSAQSASATATTTVPRSSPCVNAFAYQRISSDGALSKPQLAQCQPNCSPSCQLPASAGHRQLGGVPEVAGGAGRGADRPTGAAASTPVSLAPRSASIAGLPWYRRPS